MQFMENNNSQNSGEGIEDYSERNREQNIYQTKKALTERMRENPWMLASLVLGVITLILLFNNFSGGVTGNVVSADTAGDNLISYLNTVADSEVTLVDVEEEGGLYAVTVSYQDQEIPIYVTKDGKSYTSMLIPMVAEAPSSNSGNTKTTEVPKSDKPQLELFVMTHCPYGTQAEKGFIPFMEAMGSLVDAKIRFVHYFMHGDTEETETYNQVCIREEQSSKYLTYLREFLNEGDSEAALTKAGIDKAKLATCVKEKAKDYYATDSALSEKYGVQGSPTLVVNGVIASSGRSADAYLQTACSAFNSVPDKCTSLDLDSSNPSPMWGWDASSASASTAQC